MQLVRFAIVLFFLVVVPAAAAVDAVAPHILDSALGRNARTATRQPAPWEAEGSLALRADNKAPPADNASASLPSTESPPPASAEDAPISNSDTSLALARENSPATASATPAGVPELAAAPPPPYEPVYRGVPDVRTADANRTPATADSQLLAIQNHLSELGATYMRLETTGTRAPMYRFLCQMQISPGKVEVVPFEATAADPLEAMHKVLSDVEAWQAMEITRLRR